MQLDLYVRTDTITFIMDWSNPVGSVVQGGLGLIGSAINYKYNKALAAQQNQYNIDMWKMQAEYNSPQAQMQRFAEAGLNPNLIYGQGTSGNMSSAPEQVVPQAPELSHHMAKLGEAFNIEGLRTMVANRKKAQEDARLAELARFDKEDEREALTVMSDLYKYNSETGKYEFSPSDVTVWGGKNPRGHRIGDYSTRGGLMLSMLANNARNTYLLPYRANLLGSQNRYLQPQIMMSQYEQRFQPWSYWIGQGSKVLGSIGSLIPKVGLNFGRGFGSMPQPRAKSTWYY